MRYLIDTNVFVRFLVKDNEQMFKDCERLFLAVEAGGIKGFAPSHAMAELVWVLQSFYRFEKPKILSALKSFEIHGVFIDDRLDFSLAVELFETSSVKFLDALLASHELVQNGKAAVVSYDKDFDKLGVPRKEPKDIIQK
ncbi:MAG TPA: PIN domain-containing protein [Candidatus Paceibacterota bacterium]